MEPRSVSLAGSPAPLAFTMAAFLRCPTLEKLPPTDGMQSNMESESSIDTQFLLTVGSGASLGLLAAVVHWARKFAPLFVGSRRRLRPSAARSSTHAVGLHRSHSVPSNIVALADPVDDLEAQFSLNSVKGFELVSARVSTPMGRWNSCPAKMNTLGQGDFHLRESPPDNVGRLVAALLLKHTLSPSLPPEAVAVVYQSLSKGSGLPACTSPAALRGAAEVLEQELAAAFDAADENGDGLLNRAELQTALRRVEEHCTLGLGLAGDEVDRLLRHLGAGATQVVGKAVFVHGLRALSQSAASLGSLTLLELRDVLFYAFERFDLNSDGRITQEEFAQALLMLGIEMSPVGMRCLMGFLDPEGDGHVSTASLDTSAWGRASGLERWAGAFKVAMEAQSRRRGLDKLVLMAEAVPAKLEKVHGPVDQFGCFLAAVADFPDQVVDVIELAGDAAAVMLALRGVGLELIGVESWHQLDVNSMAPFLLFLGVIGMHIAEEVTGPRTCDLSVNEALLYVRVFQRHGFSVEEFRDLLQDCGAQWATLDAGASLDEVGTGRLTMLTTGRCNIPGSEEMFLEPGTIVGQTELLTGQPLWQPDELITVTTTSCLSWDMAMLRRRLDRGDGTSQKLAAMLAESMAKNRRTLAAAQAQNQAGWTPRSRARIAREDRFGAFDECCSYSDVDEEDRELVRTASAAARELRLRTDAAEDQMLAELLPGTPRGGPGGRQPAGNGKVGPHGVLSSVATLLDDGTLSAAFAEADTCGTGVLQLKELRQAVRLVDQRCGLALGGRLGLGDTEQAAARVAALLERRAAARETDGRGRAGVNFTAFAQGFQELAWGLQGLDGLSLRQLEQILSCALERFDSDGDGLISPDEFAAALGLLGVGIPDAAALTLHALLDGNGDGYIDPSADLPHEDTSPSSFERLAGALKVALEEQFKRKGLDTIAEDIQNSLGNSGTPWDMLQRGLGALARAEGLSKFTGLASDAAAFGASLKALANELAGVDSWDNLDISRIAPFLIFMGLSGAYVARELTSNGVSDLNEDEALLYARVFRRHNFSRKEFRQLLREGGARWDKISRPRVVGGGPDAALGFLVRGRCRLQESPRGPVGGAGTVVGEAAFLQSAAAAGGGSPEAAGGRRAAEAMVLAEGSLFVSWDPVRLRRHLALNEGTERRLRSVLSEAAAAKLFATQASPELRRAGGVRAPVPAVASVPT